eukprot:286077_1
MPTVIISGASSGMGEASVRRMLFESWTVIMIARAIDKMQKIAKDCIQNEIERNNRIKIIGFDLSKKELVETELIPKIRSFINDDKNVYVNGSIDCLINNAGGGKTPSHCKNCMLDVWEYTLALNLTAPFLLIKLLKIELMKSNYKGIGYSVSKSLTRNYATYYGPKGIRVNNIAPGYVQTPMQNSDNEKYVASITPICRTETTKDIVEMILFLADPKKSGFITGQTFVMDGGFMLPMITTQFKL